MCPSCGHKLPGVEPMNFATQVVRRTCRKCKDRWRLVVRAVKVEDGIRFDKADISFVDNSHTRRKLVVPTLAEVLRKNL